MEPSKFFNFVRATFVGEANTAPGGLQSLTFEELCDRSGAKFVDMGDDSYLDLTCCQKAELSQLVELFEHCKPDMRLSIDLQRWTSAQVATLAEALAQSDLGSIEIKGAPVEALQSMLKSLPRALNSLTLGRCVWSEGSSDLLCSMVSRCPELRCLAIITPLIAYQDATTEKVLIFEWEKKVSEVKSFGMPEVQAGSSKLITSLAAMLSASELSSLRLSDMKLVGPMYEQLVSALPTKQLQALTLDGSNLTKELVDMLACALKACARLRTLELDGFMRVDAAEAAKLLQPGLETFRCAMNSPGGATPSGGQAWKNAILNCKDLRQLNLSLFQTGGSNFGDIGAACAQHETLKIVSLHALKAIDIDCFAAQFKKSRSVEEITFTMSPINSAIGASLNHACVSMFLGNDALVRFSVRTGGGLYASIPLSAWPPGIKHALTLALPPREATVWSTLNIGQAGDVIREMAKSPIGVAQIRRMISEPFRSVVSAYYESTGERDHHLPKEITDHILAAIEPEAIFGFLNSLVRANKASAQLLGEALYLRG